MATARDVVTGALRLIGVLAAGETAQAAEATDGLAALNRMMHGWKARGVDLAHTDLALSDTVALADEYREGLEHLLAVRLAPEYERPPAPGLVVVAEEAWRAIQLAYAAPIDLTVETGLLRMPGARRGTGLR